MGRGIKEVLAKLLGVETKYKIVEVPAPRTQAGWDKDMRETIGTLSAHPGFVALISRLGLQASLLRAKLLNDRHPSLKDVEFLQSGIFWCSWLQQQVQTATTRTIQSQVDARVEDEQAFRELQATIEKVGE
jgi:hypothetical protein